VASPLDPSKLGHERFAAGNFMVLHMILPLGGTKGSSEAMFKKFDPIHSVPIKGDALLNEKCVSALSSKFTI